jgi:hypothetical protein
LTLPLDGKKAEPVAEALNEPDTEAIPYRAALPVPLAEKVEVCEPLAGMNVVAVLLAENEASTLPKAAGTTVASPLALNVATSCAVLAENELPVADELKSALNVPFP